MKVGIALIESYSFSREQTTLGIGGLAAAAKRLEDLGFVPGTRLRVLRRAPFGDPVEVELRGYRICLRAEQVAGLMVLPDRSGSRE